MDGAVVDGEYTPMFVARKTVGMHPYFEELGHLVSSADELLADPALRSTLARAHGAIDFRYGITHTELKLTERGPVIVEVNGRLGGDLIPLLAKFATGVDPGAAAVDVALGMRPHLPHEAEPRWVGVRFGYPKQDCVVESVSVPDSLRNNGILAADRLVEPGARLRLPPHGIHLAARVRDLRGRRSRRLRSGAGQGHGPGPADRAPCCPRWPCGA